MRLISIGCHLFGKTLLAPLTSSSPSYAGAALHTSACLARGRFRQKVSHMDRYRWIYMVKKHKKRALFPWIPREAPTGLNINDHFVEFAEMRPEFVVPPDVDLCELRPYVDWRAKVVEQSEFTAEDLFSATYAEEIADLHGKGKINLDRVPEEYADRKPSSTAKQ